MAPHRHYQGPLTDSARWQSVALRPDDVIVVTPPKSGTTWMQAIIALLLSGDPQIAPEPTINMPWIDMRARDIAEVTARLEARPGRRCLKSHTPLDGLPLHAKAQYICVFRHPLDVHFSFRNHVANVPIDVFDPWYPDDPEQTFDHFLKGAADDWQCDAVPLRHVLRHYTCAKDRAHLPNVTLFHYADMTRDLGQTMQRVADLLQVAHPPSLMAALTKAASFENMKANAAKFAPAGGQGFFKSDAGFFHSGSSGKWQTALSTAQKAAYDRIIAEALPPGERAWLEFGSKNAL